MCPHTAIYVSSYCYICVLILVLCMCPHTSIMYVSSYCYICVLILPHLCPSYYYLCVVIVLSMCPHTTMMYVSSYCYICVRILLLCMCPHTATYVSSYYYYVCVLILLSMCPHTTVHVSSYYYDMSSYCYTCPHAGKWPKHPTTMLTYAGVCLAYADVCWRMLTYAVLQASDQSTPPLCWRMLTYADVCWRMLTYADVCGSTDKWPKHPTTGWDHWMRVDAQVVRCTSSSLSWRMLAYAWRMLTYAGTIGCVLMRRSCAV